MKSIKKIFVPIISMAFLLTGCPNNAGGEPEPAPVEDYSLVGIDLSGDYQKEFTINTEFSYEGLIVTAYYSNKTSKVVTPTSVSTPDMTSVGTKEVVVSYTEKEITKAVKYNVVVKDEDPLPEAILQSISLSGNYPTTFDVDDTFSHTGLVVTAHYNVGNDRTVIPTSVSTPDMSQAGTQTVTVAYTEKTVTKAATYTITINGTSDEYYTGYYKTIKKSWTGSTLKAELKKINTPKSTSYDWSRYEAADEALDDSTSIISLYTRHNIKKSSHCGNYAWDKWNREHIWTQTAYPKSASDNHNIFACEGKINGVRSNDPFAELTGAYVVIDNKDGTGAHQTECRSKGGEFEPCDAAKGEVARSVMYGAVQYDYTITQIATSAAMLIKWHTNFPVAERDTKRNETVYGLQGNRNPFVDHPEFASKIWGSSRDIYC